MDSFLNLQATSLASSRVTIPVALGLPIGEMRCQIVSTHWIASSVILTCFWECPLSYNSGEQGPGHVTNHTTRFIHTGHTVYNIAVLKNHDQNWHYLREMCLIIHFSTIRKPEQIITKSGSNTILYKDIILLKIATNRDNSEKPRQTAIFCKILVAVPRFFANITATNSGPWRAIY